MGKIGMHRMMDLETYSLYPSENFQLSGLVYTKLKISGW